MTTPTSSAPPRRFIRLRTAPTVSIARLRTMAGAVALVAFGVSCTSDRSNADTSADMSQGYRGAVPLPALPKPSFTLIDTDGKSFDFKRDSHSRLTFLFFGYTSCPDICPIHMANLAAVMNRLPEADRARIQVVFVSTDPDRDSPQRLRSWLDNFDHAFIGLRGERDEINRIEMLVGVAPSTLEQPASDVAPRDSAAYGVGHSASVFAFTPDDSLRVIYPSSTGQADWAHDIPRLLTVGK